MAVDGSAVGSPTLRQFRGYSDTNYQRTEHVRSLFARYDASLLTGRHERSADLCIGPIRHCSASQFQRIAGAES